MGKAASGELLGPASVAGGRGTSPRESCAMKMLAQTSMIKSRRILKPLWIAERCMSPTIKDDRTPYFYYRHPASKPRRPPEPGLITTRQCVNACCELILCDPAFPNGTSVGVSVVC